MIIINVTWSICIDITRKHFTLTGSNFSSYTVTVIDFKVLATSSDVGAFDGPALNFPLCIRFMPYRFSCVADLSSGQT